MKGCLKLIGYSFAALFVIAVIAAIFGNNTERSATTATTTNTQRASSGGQVVVLPTATPEPATPIPEWMALSFLELCDNNDRLTDIQQEDLAASQAGKKVVGWTGWVYDVERRDDAYMVQIDMTRGIFKSRQIEIMGVSRDVAAALNVDQQVIFDGTIQSVEMFASDICNPIIIVDATITPQ